MLPIAHVPATQLTVDDALHPVRPSSAVIDVLSEFIPGQKLLAQVQAQLANGAYRATIAQRDVTLALPFSAKAGDSLELEVVETDGRIAFAVSRQKLDSEGVAASSATTTLSRTGQMIARLLSTPGQEADQPTVLNEGRVLLTSASGPARETAATLQQAVTKSGLFYESHQAAWLGGRFAESALRSEPQGLLLRMPSANLQNSAPNAAQAPNAGQSSSATQGGHIAANALSQTGASTAAAGATAAATLHRGTIEQEIASLGDRSPAENSAAGASGSEAAKTAAATRSTLPPEIAPLVQQQLSSLGNNVYTFHGMAWAGQPILWEVIDENQQRRHEEPDEAPRQWKTRLKMLLPVLGDIDAMIQLDGNDVSIQMTSGTDHTLGTLKSGLGLLQQRFELAGLRLSALDLRPLERPLRPSENDEPR